MLKDTPDSPDEFKELIYHIETFIKKSEVNAYKETEPKLAQIGVGLIKTQSELDRFRIEDLFKLHKTGLTTGLNRLAIQFSREEMKKIIEDITQLTTEQVGEKYELKKDEYKKVKKMQKDLKKNGVDYEKYNR